MMKIKKKRTNPAKPATEAQKQARERNWNKGQILAIRTIANNIYHSKTTHKKEQTTLGIIIDACNEIHQHWNK